MQIQNPWVAAVAVVCLTVMEVVALSRGIDGTLFALVTASIGGIAGYALHRREP